MPGSWEPNAPYLSQLTVRIRALEHQSLRLIGRDWNTGGCGVVSEVLDVRYGWQRSGGCYASTPEAHHIAHYWNILPDGRILDATADQFGEPDVNGRVRITAGGDPRYLDQCDGDACDPL